MARRKTTPDLVREKCSLAERLRTIRAELFGERGGPELARRLGIPVRTWYNYEAGVTVPAEVVLRIIQLTSLEPAWLSTGEGPKFRLSATESTPSASGADPSVRALLRTALHRLEKDAASPRGADAFHWPQAIASQAGGHHQAAGRSLMEVNGVAIQPLSWGPGVNDGVASREWFEAGRESRCIHVVGDAMFPLLSDGACVAFASSEEPATELDGKLVVALGEVPPIVRWFQDCGRYALLRAENVATEPVLIEFEDRSEFQHFRRVLWVNTPH